MNGLRTRQTLDRAHQHAPSRHTGDTIVGWICCIGLAVFMIYELSGRYL